MHVCLLHLSIRLMKVYDVIHLHLTRLRLPDLRSVSKREQKRAKESKRVIERGQKMPQSKRNLPRRPVRPYHDLILVFSFFSLSSVWLAWEDGRGREETESYRALSRLRLAALEYWMVQPVSRCRWPSFCLAYLPSFCLRP